jgi:hypothetical protein
MYSPSLSSNLYTQNVSNYNQFSSEKHFSPAKYTPNSLGQTPFEMHSPSLSSTFYTQSTSDFSLSSSEKLLSSPTKFNPSPLFENESLSLSSSFYVQNSGDKIRSSSEKILSSAQYTPNILSQSPLDIYKPSQTSNFYSQSASDFGLSSASEKLLSTNQRTASPQGRSPVELSKASPSSGFGTQKTNDSNRSFSEKNGSPNKYSPSPLGWKIEDVQTSLKAEGKAEIYEWETKTKILNDRVQTDNYMVGEKLKPCVDQITKVEGRIQTQFIPYEVLSESKKRQVREVESNIATQLEIENLRSRNMRHQIFYGFDTKIFNLRTEVTTEKKEVKGLLKRGYLEMASHINILQDGIEDEKKIRIENNSKLVKKVNTQISKIQDTLQMEKKIRQETEDLLLKTLEEMNKSLRVQMKKEKESREKEETQMVKLLEMACDKLENQVTFDQEEIFFQEKQMEFENSNSDDNISI